MHLAAQDSPTVSTTSPLHDTLVARQARLRVWREGLGLIATTMIIGMGFIGPLLVVIAGAIPQVVAALPEPARQATLYFDGLPGDDDVLAEGADGEQDDGSLDPEAGDLVDAPDDGAEDGVAEGADEVTEEAAAATPEPKPADKPKPKPKPEPTPEAEETEEVEVEPSEATVEAVEGDQRPGSVDEAKARADKLAKAKAAEEAKKAKRRGRCEEKHPDIKQVMDNHWAVNRSLIDYYTSSMERFNSLGYSRKYKEGDDKGWLVGGFGCRSPLWKGGLRSNDVLQTVNGKKTNNVLQLFGIWAGQRNRDKFEIVVLRKGEPVTLKYTIISG